METYLNLNNVVVNLQNVSNINIINSTGRIVFNMNYTIEISRDSKKKFISDYVYWDVVTEEELQENIETIESNKFIQSEFIRIGNSMINKNEISTVKFLEQNSRIVFNLSHPVSFRNGKGLDLLTSEFVYINCEPREFKECVKVVKSELGII